MTTLKSIVSLAIASIFIAGCEKNTTSADQDVATPNWEIVQNFPQDQSYDIAKLAVYKGEAFVYTYGRSLSGQSGALSDEFTGSFFVKKSDGHYYRNYIQHEAVIALKEFDGSLYGIREKRTIFRTVPVLSYQHSYTLFKWENDNYVDMDVLEYTDLHHQAKSSLGTLLFWVNNNKLHVIGWDNSPLLWELNSTNKLAKVGATGYLYYEPLGTRPLLTDNKEISFTNEYEFAESSSITRRRVHGNYYSSSGTVTKGQVHEFYIQYLADGSVYNSTVDAAFYQAIDGHLWGLGFEGNKAKNYDTETIIGGISDDKTIRTAIQIPNNGKCYMMLANEKQGTDCAGLAIFDGKALREIPFVLPEPLDPCSKLIDATEYQGKVYMLLLNRGQYVVVKQK